MLDFLSMIGNAILTVFQLLINLILGLVNFFQLIFEFTAYLGLVVAYIPAPLVVFVMMGITISVLLLIVGRN